VSSRRSGDVRYASKTDRIEASQQNVARCQRATYAAQQVLVAFGASYSAAWQSHREHGALAHLARHGHVASHHACELARDGKPESRSAIAARCQDAKLVQGEKANGGAKKLMLLPLSVENVTPQVPGPTDFARTSSQATAFAVLMPIPLTNETTFLSSAIEGVT
jgi:hypothetical protein